MEVPILFLWAQGFFRLLQVLVGISKLNGCIHPFSLGVSCLMKDRFRQRRLASHELHHRPLAC